MENVWGFILTGAWSIISAILIFLLQQQIKDNRALKRQKEDIDHARNEALKKGMVCILRKHLMDEHEIWTSKGFITSKALENGLAMYHAYKVLGGNGMIDHMEEEIQALPIRD